MIKPFLVTSAIILLPFVGPVDVTKMTSWLARKGGMGPDGVYRDPAAYAPKLSFLVAEPGIQALQTLLISFCLFCSLWAYSSVLLHFFGPFTSLLSSIVFRKTWLASPGWLSSHRQTILLGFGTVCTILLLYAWCSVIRRVAQGFRLPEKLTKSTRPPSWMKGTVAVVTGGNAGIGLATTEQLVRWGAHVLVGCRRVDEASVCAQRFLAENSCSTHQNAATSSAIKRKSAVQTRNTSAYKATTAETGTIRVHYLDLMDLESVDAFAKWACAESGGKIDFLINNAGIMSTEPLTVDSRTGFEKHFVTNHLGPFLLTQLLLPAVKKANGRIINVSSMSHVTHGPRPRALDYAVSPEAATAIASKLKRPLSQLQGEPLSARNYDSRRVYGDTKLFNIWFTKALQRRLTADKQSTATAYALHPGLVNTDLMLHYSQGTKNWFTNFLGVVHRIVAPLILKTPERGAATQLMLCVADQQQLKPGAFYKDGINSWVAPMALDEEKQEELWDISMVMCQAYLSGRSSTSAPPEGQKGKAKARTT